MVSQKESKPKKRLNPILLSKDQAILKFLWRHRIATFKALKTIFYPEMSAQQAYYQLRRLRRGQFVKVDMIDGTKKTTWRLDLRGFQYLTANSLPALKTKGFRTYSPYHDLVVASALLGGWVNKCPSNVKIVTEQEMNALDLAFLPTEIRKEREHQADGIWIFQTGKERKAIALEVELSAKTDERYEQTCSFYASQLFFENVIWVVSDRTLAQRILDASQRHGVPREGLHLFVLQKNFERLGWNSKFENKSLEHIALGTFLSRRAGSKFLEVNHPRITGESPSDRSIGSAN